MTNAVSRVALVLLLGLMLALGSVLTVVQPSAKAGSGRAASDGVLLAMPISVPAGVPAGELFKVLAGALVANDCLNSVAPCQPAALGGTLCPQECPPVCASGACALAPFKVVVGPSPPPQGPPVKARRALDLDLTPEPLPPRVA